MGLNIFPVILAYEQVGEKERSVMISGHRYFYAVRGRFAAKGVGHPCVVDEDV